MSPRRSSADEPTIDRAAPCGSVRLAHLGLVVSDLRQMEGFYAAVLGLRISDRGVSPRRRREMVFMTGDAQIHHYLVLIPRPGGPSLRERLDHMAFAVASLADLRAIRDRAQALGATEIRAVDHGNAWSLYFRDPEGNHVEVLVDTPFEMPQPYGRTLDLGRDDAEIVQATRLACNAKGTAP